MGFLPDAVLNYLARLGWSHGDQEVFTRDELIQHFGWDHCGRTAAQYDLKKFQFVQASHLRMKSSAELASLVSPRIKEGAAIDSDAHLASAIETVKTRATTLNEAAEMVDFYFREPLVFDEKAVAKFLVKENEPHLRAIREVVAAVEPFDQKSIEAAVNAWLETSGLSMKNVAQPARVALTGKTQSPGLFEVMDVLGKARTLARLDQGAAKAAG
jgi:glutamyl-tRNA synthetase